MGEVPVRVDVKVQVDKREVAKLVDVAADVFSVATESLGLLGDAVRLARVELATKITRRAKEVADANGLKLTAPPLKFLVPFYERASVESDEDPSLVEMWSNLLVSAGSQFVGKQQRYVSILSELTPQQARILDQIMTNFGGELTSGWVFDLEFDLSESRFSTDIRQRVGDKSAEDALEVVLRSVCVPGVSVVHVATSGIADPVSDYFDWADDPVYDDEKAVDYGILQSHGLIVRVATPFIDAETASVTATYYVATPMGHDFWNSCRGPKKLED